MQNRTWAPTELERIVGVLGTVLLAMPSGLLTWVIYPHSEQPFTWYWLIPFSLFAFSLGMLWRLLFTRKRGLTTFWLLVVSSLFLVSGIALGYLGYGIENYFKTGLLGGISLLCVAIGMFNLARLWRHREDDA